MRTLVSPAGIEISGTLDTIEGVALIEPELDQHTLNGRTLDLEYAGGTSVLWGTQKPQSNSSGIRIFQDEKGNNVLESDLCWIDEDAGITEPQRLFPIPGCESASGSDSDQASLGPYDAGQLQDIAGLIRDGANDSCGYVLGLSDEALKREGYAASDVKNIQAKSEFANKVVADIAALIERRV